MLKAAFITANLADPSARLRIRKHLPLLARRGVDASAFEIPHAGRGRFGFLRGLWAFDAVVLHRKLLPWLDLLLLRRSSRALIYDFDDAVMRRVPWKGGGSPWTRRLRFERTLSRADSVIAGSPLLRDLLGPAKDKCVVLPTAVDLGPFTPAAPYPGGLAVFGWIGQKSSLPYLEGISGAVAGACGRLAGSRLRVIADEFPSIPGAEVERRPWSAAAEARDLAGIHAGLAPLTDDPWSAGKCAYKVLQYFAAARPAIASPVGMNAVVVRDGVNGIHVRTMAEWADSMCRIAGDRALATRMGEAGRSLVEKEYTLEAVSAGLAEVIERAVSAGRR